MGHDSAVRPEPPQKDTGPQRIVKNPGSILSPPSRRGRPAVVEVGAIDWRFADPFADVLAGFNLSGLSGSPAAIRVISQLGAKQDLSQAEMDRIFEALSGVNQIALSIRDNRTLVMVTGRVADSTFAELPPGWKATPLAGTGMLMGQAEAVDQAAQRVATEAPLTETGQLASEHQSDSDFWALAKPFDQHALSAGVKRHSLMLSIDDRLTIDQAYELNQAPDASALRAWPANLSGAAVEGNIVHVRLTMENDEVPDKFGAIAAAPLGQNLGTLVKLARYLPERQAVPVDHTKPVIYGLDDGPKVVKQ